jgi:hypothetical protein
MHRLSITQSIQSELHARESSAERLDLQPPPGISTEVYTKRLERLKKQVAAGVSSAMVRQIWNYWWLEGGGQKAYLEQRRGA